MKSWMQTELNDLNLGDKRRNDRFRKIVESAFANPTASVPQAQEGWYNTKTTYQFWEIVEGDPAAVVTSYCQGQCPACSLPRNGIGGSKY